MARASDRSRSPKRDDLFGWESDGDSDIDNESGSDAEGGDFGKQLEDLLLSQFCLGKMDATILCQICYLSVKAGACGDGLKRMALRPGESSGNYSKHLKKYIPVDCSDLYTIKVPGHIKGSREQMNLLIAAPHVVLEEEMQRLSATGEVDIKHKIESLEWADSYESHPKFCRKDGSDQDRRLVVPCALYMDGVKYTRSVGPKQDSMLGITVYNIATGRRHLVTTVAKRDLCRCGCRGYCTTFSIFEFIRWSLQVSWHTQTFPGFT